MEPDRLQGYFPSERFGMVRAAAPITNGLSGASVYAVTTDAGEFILRIREAKNEAIARILTAEPLAAQHGLAPAIVHVDEAAGAIVSAKITGTPFRSALAQPSLRPVVITKLVDCLARLHAIQAPSLPATDFPAIGLSIWNQQADRNGFPAWALPLRSAIAAGGAVFISDQRRVFSHNDLSPGNLLWDGSQVWMLDWELSAVSHPYLDLATFSNFADLSDEDALELLALQEQAVITEGHRAEFLVLRSFSRAVFGAIFLGFIPDLAQMEFESRDATPTISDCYRRIGKGDLDHKTPAGQAQLGAALLRQGLG
jgi:aminoglycoside phosphotransferase (APT) family kinase protein